MCYMYCCCYAVQIGKDDSDGVDMAYRVVADHIRTLSFSIAGGWLDTTAAVGTCVCDTIIHCVAAVASSYVEW